MVPRLQLSSWLSFSLSQASPVGKWHSGTTAMITWEGLTSAADPKNNHLSKPLADVTGQARKHRCWRESRAPSSRCLRRLGLSSCCECLKSTVFSPLRCLMGALFSARAQFFSPGLLGALLGSLLPLHAWPSVQQQLVARRRRVGAPAAAVSQTRACAHSTPVVFLGLLLFFVFQECLEASTNKTEVMLQGLHKHRSLHPPV